jgi:outer membrane receptor protein involved in Fe transport
MRQWFTSPRVSAIFLMLMVLAAPAAYAQTVTGTIQGTVTDTSGGVLPGVTVLIKHQDTGAERVVVTNESGFYSAPYMPLGTYNVTATLASFGTIARQGIQVGLNETRVVDFKLDPKLTAEVTVTGDAPPINATNATVKSSLTAEEIMDKPSLNAGSFLSLAEIFPGFQENPTSGQNNSQSSSGSSINFNNTGTRGATFQINGVNNDDSSENQHRQGVSLSTIESFTILKNGYSAEFGRGDGGVVLVQTKGGTNKWHGDAYLYKQDSDWNARRFFAVPGSPKPVNQRSQFGFTAGFPVLMNRLFGYVNVDRTESNGENAYTRDLPLPSELAVPWLTRGNDTPENRAFITSVLARFPKVTPNDPRSPRTYTGVATFDFPDEDYSVRGDWNMRQNNMFSARYQWTRQLRKPEDVIVGEQAHQKNRQQNVGLTWTHIVGGRLAGEARYGLGVRSTNVVIASGESTPIIRFSGLPVSGPIIGNAGSLPIVRDQLDHQFVYNLTWQWFTNHSLKAGTDIRRQQLDDFADNNSRGSWSYTTACGGTSYANGYLAFLDGCVTSFTKSWGPLFLENRINESNLYVQDDWKLLDTLTLNLGLRYEYVAAPYEAKKRIDYGFSADDNNIEPRIGVNYAPRWDSGVLRALSGGAGNMAIQAGYGLYDGRIFQSIFSQNGASVRTNPPNATSRTFSTSPGILNHSDPTLGFVFVPGLPAGRITLVLPDPELEMPQTEKWNVSVERIMPFKSTLKVTYQANHNDKRLKYAIQNLPQSPLYGPVLVVDHPNNAPAAGFPDLRGKYITRVAADVQCAGTGFLPNINVTTACPNPVPLGDDEVSLRVPRTNERRPDPRYTNNLLISNDAEAWYDGIEFEWNKRLQRGLSFKASYTYSRSLDTTSEATFVGGGDTNQNGPNKKYSKGYSRFHTPHRFTFNGSYRLPFLANRTDLLGQAFGGWQWSGVLVLASGTPFSVTDAARDLDFDGFAESRPVIVDRSILGAHVDNRDTSQQILRREAFRPTTFGDKFEDLAPRNAFFGDGLRRVDMALAKTFRLPWRGHYFGARIEGFNVFNWVVFGFPNTDSTSASFGAITGNSVSYSPRTVQLRLQYRY